jgi:hypothetical protein
MKLFKYGKDGGENSTVWGFWVVESKPLFSIALLCFEKGSREAFHSHAFNAYTWFVKGEVDEHHLDGRILTWKPSWKVKLTPRSTFHKVFAKKRTYAITFRGPWQKEWQEYLPATHEYVTLTNGRKIVERKKA